MFSPSRQTRAFEDVVRQIQEAILKGSLKPGARLPAERQLQDTFQVSRGTLREALRTLEQKGLITIKTGTAGGAIVRAVDTKLVSESLDLLLRYQKISLKELAEFREAVEGVVASKAARKATRQDVRTLRALVRSIRGYLDADSFDWSGVVREDNRFHFHLARIAGNRIFESIVQTIYENISPYFERFLSHERGLMERNYQDLCRILEAIEKRDPDAARLLVQRHVRYFNRRMEEGKIRAKT
ncbi:MAG: GntR family transcriptional regulator [candidate division NC10 bacterium]|jgi:DNA-binding FadR family transcriptional regulator|nr:GntR family transcriptional regulator [candidate division NC10 bacterium]